MKRDNETLKNQKPEDQNKNQKTWNKTGRDGSHVYIILQFEFNVYYLSVRSRMELLKILLSMKYFSNMSQFFSANRMLIEIITHLQLDS